MFKGLYIKYHMEKGMTELLISWYGLLSFSFDQKNVPWMDINTIDMKTSRVFYLLCLMALVVSCNQSSDFRIDPEYETEFSAYSQRLEDGRVKYLQLAGLFKFNEAESSFGSSESAVFKVDSPSAADLIGQFMFTVDSTGAESVSFQANEGIVVKTENDSIISSIEYELDEYGSSVPLFSDEMKWQVITSSGSLYLRVCDNKHPMVEKFEGYERYQLSPEFMFNAEFKYYEKSPEKEVKSQLGVNATTSFIGTVEFEYQGKLHTLEVGSNGFTMVSDDTSGNETYGGGRYIYLDLPEEDGPVIIDFNRLYNPPCSFSQYTTCLYPPPGNNLPFDLKAGETIKRL